MAATLQVVPGDRPLLPIDLPTTKISSPEENGCFRGRILWDYESSHETKRETQPKKSEQRKKESKIELCT